jgi:hypothetical protein
VGAQRLTDLEVLGLENLPDAYDGLLGMDLLDQIDGFALP